MVEFRVLNGKAAGATFTARRFPFTIGRSRSSDLCLAEPGVWDRHLHFDLDPSHGVTLTVVPDARVTVNGEGVQTARLRNGDLLEVGAVRLRFGLAAARQRDLRPREILTWLALAALCAAELGFCYLL